MAGKGRQGVDYIKPKEPSFLAKFKREIGYKEGPTIDSKTAETHLESDDDHHDAHDEQPLVVVLKEGDLSKEEYEEHLKKDGDGTGDSPTSSDSPPSKLSFKKPSKRTSGLTSPSVQFGSSKKKKDKEKSRLNNKNKKVKNESLLSFGDEDEDET